MATRICRLRARTCSRPSRICASCPEGRRQRSGSRERTVSGCPVQSHLSPTPMIAQHLVSRRAVALALAALGFAPVAPLAAQRAAAPSNAAAPRGTRPMSFLDMQNMRQIGAPAPSPDGRWVLYTLSVPDWKEARRQNDIYLVSPQQGVPSTKRL